MSTFFKALERAEQERALSQPAPKADTGAAPTAPDRETTVVRTSGPASPGAASTPLLPAPHLDRGSAPQSVFNGPNLVLPRYSGGQGEQTVGVEEHLVSLLAPSSFEAEQYRALRHLIEQLHRASELSIIAISSADGGDGKTTSSINLAGALAQAHDTRVLLVDGDLRGANLAGDLGLDERAPGLVDAILDTRLTLGAVTQVCPTYNLSVISAGRLASAPYEVLKSVRVGELFTEAREKYDYVIVDTPPLVSVPDSRLLGKWVDGFLIVVAAHRTPRKLVQEALNLVDAAKIVGIVFNGDDRPVSRNVYSSRRRGVVLSRPTRRQTASD